MVSVQSKGYLFDVRTALHPSRRLAGGLNCRHEKAHEKADYRDYD
jgi:hypothetical protein